VGLAVDVVADVPRLVLGQLGQPHLLSSAPDPLTVWRRGEAGSDPGSSASRERACQGRVTSPRRFSEPDPEPVERGLYSTAPGEPDRRGPTWTAAGPTWTGPRGTARPRRGRAETSRSERDCSDALQDQH
jgi:hypothetical protein